MPMLAEIVDIVIGVDTHKHTNTAAAVSATTTAVIDNATAATDPNGYASLVALADRSPGLRAWAIEGANGYGAGLARFLADRGEWVIELDRPTRAKRRHGAKSDPIDAVRAAREALAREHLAEPRADGERAALSVRLAARRLAVDAATDAQRQIHGLVVAAPEQLRARLRGKTTTEMLRICSRLRADARWDLTTRETAVVLRCLARRSLALAAEAQDHEKRSSRSCGPGAPTFSTIAVSDQSWQPPCCAHGHIQAASATTPRSRCSPAPHPSQHLQASPCVTDSTDQATVASTRRSTRSCSPASASTRPRRPTSNADAPRARPTAKSNDA